MNQLCRAYRKSSSADWYEVKTPSGKKLSALADVLWLERNVLELLLFRLVEANLILVAEETRFVPQALAEVEEVVARLRGAEAKRRKSAAALAAELGVVDRELSLDYLASNLPDPARIVFEGHRDGFMRLAAEIEQITLENRRLTSRAMQNITQNIDTLLGGDSEPTTYTSHGRPASSVSGPVRLDEVM